MDVSRLELLILASICALGAFIAVAIAVALLRTPRHLLRRDDSESIPTRPRSS